MRDRYNDSDVHRDPSLTLEALRYLETYTGTFEFLVSCRYRVEQGKSLTTPQIRGVLNCMRVDPKVDEPEPQPVPEWIEEQRRKEEEERRRRRKRILRTKVKFNKRFGIAHNGKVLHRLPLQGYCEWRHPFYGETPKTGYPEQHDLVVRWNCGNKTKNPRMLNERPNNIRYCKSGCFSVDCTNCGAPRQHLSPDKGPNEKIVCAECGAANAQEIING